MIFYIFIAHITLLRKEKKDIDFATIFFYVHSLYWPCEKKTCLIGLDQERLKPACLATDTTLNIETS